MSMVGSLGTIIFNVSEDKIETIFDIKKSSSASFGKHQRHTGNTLLEYVGDDADVITFNMTLSAQLGVNVEGELSKLDAMKRSGKAVKFFLGKKVIGRYRWVIEKYSVNMKYFGKGAVLEHADVSITIVEYNKWK